MTGTAIKTLRYLIKMGFPGLAKKLEAAIKTGKVANLTKKESDIFSVVRHDLMKTSSEFRPMSADVALRRELFYNPTGGQLGGGSFGRGYFSAHKKVPMVDIDLPGPSHSGMQVMFETKKDAMQNFLDFMKTKFGKKTAWKLYDTPAGIRMFDISKKSRGARPRFYEGVSQELGSDPYYIAFSRSKGTYDSRLMPKPGRKGDFVARPINRIGQKKVFKGEDATIDPMSWKEVRSAHDMLIQQILRNKRREGNVNLGGLFDMLPNPLKF